MIEEYYKDAIKDQPKRHHNFLGIDRKKHPKWQGWKLLGWYKSQEVDINDIDDSTLDILVFNFYFLKYLKETNLTLPSADRV